MVFPNYKSHPAYQAKPSVRTRVAVLDRFFPLFATYFLRALKFRGKTFPGGAAQIQFSSAEIELLKKIARQNISLIEERKLKLGNRRKFQDSTELLTEGREIITKILNDHGLIKKAEAIRGFPMKLGLVVVQVSDESDQEHKNVFKDTGYPDSPTAYMHVDSTIGWMKCLVYLTPVELGNGPFSYVLDSNKWNLLDYVATKVTDKMQLNDTDPKTRERFSALPKIFQKKTHFGYDVIDPETIRDLLKREKKFTSTDGNCIFFDSDGIHRGGMVKNGRRIALQIALVPR
jgi:hypothetical protein